MNKKNIFFSLLFIVSTFVYSQDVKTLEESITGEDLRIEKSEIFVNPSFSHEIFFPSIPTMPPEEKESVSIVEVETENEIEETNGLPISKESVKYFNIVADSYNTYGFQLFYEVFKGDFYRLFDLNVVNSEGYRDNDEKLEIFLDYLMESITTKVSANLITGSMSLPGRVGNPLTLIRNYHQFKSSYTYKWESGFSFKWEDSFYSIDDIETNYATIGLLYDNQDFSYNTEIERYDSFGEKDSLMSFYQGVLFQGEKFKVGGGLKKIEGNNLKFLPKFKFDLTPNLIFSLDTSYKIPNLWSEIILYNYKKIDKPQLSPEEEYELNLAWSKEIESRNLNLYLSQTYIKNGYLWADINKNGFLEPISKEYWKTCLGCDIKQRVLKNFTLFLKGEREFFDKDIYYYPEIKLDTGFILGDNNISLKAWVSHIGKRKFVDENLKPYTLFNVELKLNQKEKIQWIVGVSNICGQKYFVSPGYPAEERKFYGVVKLYF